MSVLYLFSWCIPTENVPPLVFFPAWAKNGTQHHCVFPSWLLYRQVYCMGEEEKNKLPSGTDASHLELIKIICVILHIIWYNIITSYNMSPPWFIFSCFKCMYLRLLLQPLTGKDWAESLCDRHRNFCSTDTSPTLLDAVLSINSKEAEVVSVLQDQEMGKKGILWGDTLNMKSKRYFFGYLFRERRWQKDWRGERKEWGTAWALEP